MSIIGKKVIVVVPFINEKGEKEESKNVTYEGVVVDKFKNGFPHPNPNSTATVQTENYLIQKDNGELENVHPSFLTRIVD